LYCNIIIRNGVGRLYSAIRPFGRRKSVNNLHCLYQGLVEIESRDPQFRKGRNKKKYCQIHIPTHLSLHANNAF